MIIEVISDDTIQPKDETMVEIILRAINFFDEGKMVACVTEINTCANKFELITLDYDVVELLGNENVLTLHSNLNDNGYWTLSAVNVTNGVKTILETHRFGRTSLNMLFGSDLADEIRTIWNVTPDMAVIGKRKKK